MAGLVLRGLCKSYGGLEILKGIDLDIAGGEFVVFVGPSGCGKSTLLRCIAGLEEITVGQLTIEGRDMTHARPAKRGIAMVFQSYALYPHMTVRENIAYPLRLQRRTKAEIAEKVAAAAQKLQLGPLLDRLPRELSGGQRQRVAIGRAIVREPKIFLFDEPLSNLDAALRVATRQEIADLKASLPETTMIYVTHDQVEAMTLADRVVVLREGHVEQVGTPMDLYQRPSNRFVAGFIGSPKMNFLSGALAAPFDASEVGVRPEHLVISDSGPWTGRIRGIENLGSDCYLHLTLDEDYGENAAVKETVILRLDALNGRAINDRLTVAPLAGHLHRFNSVGLAI